MTNTLKNVPIEIQLSDKGAELVVLEEHWNNLLFKDINILNNKGFPIVRPTRDRRITRINHVKRFCWK